jgi:hypothetical protein
VEQSFKKCFITNAFNGTEDGILWDSSDLDCLDLKSDLEKYVDSQCDTGCTSEEHSEQTNLFNLNFQFCVDLYLLMQ